MALAPHRPENRGDSPVNQATACPNGRAALRRAMLARRDSLSERELSAAAAAIQGHLDDLFSSLPPATLAFCWPVRNEFDTRPLASRLALRGWRLCLPVVIAENAPMIFRPWHFGCAMGADRYGIPIPLDGEALVPDIALLPLVAFDAAGYRLGYGGGYFDRTLASLVPRPRAVGVGYEVTRVESLHPEPHDIPLDAVVTEAGVETHTG